MPEETILLFSRQGGSSRSQYCIAFLLMMLGGFLDAYSYILKGGVFACMQTGNVTFMVLALVKGDYGLIGHYVLPVLFFSLGILSSEFIKSGGAPETLTGKRKLIILIKIVCFGFIGAAGESLNDPVAISLIAYLAALQVSSYDQLRGGSFASTMITGNLRTSMVHLHKFILTREREPGVKSLLYLILILFFAVGVALGALASRRYEERAAFLCLVLLIPVFILLSTEGEK